MTYIAAAELAGLVVFGWLLFRLSDRHMDHLSREYDKWRDERRDLITRIQTARPVFPTTDFDPPEQREPDELAKVGTIAMVPPSDDDAA